MIRKTRHIRWALAAIAALCEVQVLDGDLYGNTTDEGQEAIQDAVEWLWQQAGEDREWPQGYQEQYAG